MRRDLRPTFAWVWSGSPTDEEERAQHFSILVAPRGGGKPVLQKIVDRGPIVADKPLPARDYSWQVVEGTIELNKTGLTSASAKGFGDVRGSSGGLLAIGFARTASFRGLNLSRKNEPARRFRTSLEAFG